MNTRLLHDFHENVEQHTAQAVYSSTIDPEAALRHIDKAIDQLNEMRRMIYMSDRRSGEVK